ncbi:MAG: hypothetical protein HC809_17070 [Gammaproteobacteria bacterium]|nr:hypothetical protein [Gammaproteobacteria bacterium]
MRHFIRFAAQVLAILAVVACSEQPATLRLLAPELPLDRLIVEQMAGLTGSGAGPAIRIVPLPAGMDSLEMLSAGDADLALVENNEAFRGEIRAVLPLYSTVLHIAYRGEARSELTELLETGTVQAGPPASVTRLMLARAAALLGRDAAQFDYVDFDECADVIVVFAPIRRDVPERVAQCGTYHLFSIGDVERIGRGSLIDALTLLDPRLRAYVIPQNTYGAPHPRCSGHRCGRQTARCSRRSFGNSRV